MRLPEVADRLREPASAHCNTRIRAIQDRKDTMCGVPPITLPQGMGATYAFCEGRLIRDGVPQRRDAA